MRGLAATVIVLLFAGVVAEARATASVDDCAQGNPLSPQAEMFATNNTETIANPADPRLQDSLGRFASDVERTILANAALPVGSDRLDGVFWSEDLQQLTFESSRQFHLACVDGRELTRIAETVAGEFRQESVLTFTYQPDDAPIEDSFIAKVPGVDVQRFRDAFAADADARNRLGGGSVTEDGSLVLVAADQDAQVAKRVVAVSGGELDMSGVRHGTRRFVPWLVRAIAAVTAPPSRPDPAAAP
jgi:hypothetical protein